MSTPEPFAGVRADRPAERALFRAMFDDAAVFPPGLSPLSQAVTEHVGRQAKSYADLVGPLLLPAEAGNELLGLLGPEQTERLRPVTVAVTVAVIGRPGTDLTLVHETLSGLRENPAITMMGVEIGWSAHWHQALGWNAPLSVEVPRGADQERALSELQQHARGSGLVQAKFRTGSIPGLPIPTPTELATFIRSCVDHDLGFKLTGGLHHAISSTHTTSSDTSGGVEDQFGFLNVIAATRWALAHGAEVPEMKALLSQRDPGPILDIITRMSEADASVVRAFFTAYGCCGVMDPIGDLAALGLIKEKSV